MARAATPKVIRFHQWFSEKYGNEFENPEDWVPPQGIANTHRAYMFDLPMFDVSFNFCQKYMREIQVSVNKDGSFNAMYDADGRANLLDEDIPKFDDTIKVNRKPGQTGTGTAEPDEASSEPVDATPTPIDDMEFPEFKLHHTGTVVDKLDSDFSDEGGQYGGTVTICTGESGVGKSTVLIDKLAKYKKINPDIKLCYFSTEMTRNDLYFYRMKNPMIGQVPTVLSTDFMEGNRLKQAIIQIFEGDYDIILLDSYQDLMGTVKDLLGWSEGASTRFIIGLMIEAAEKRGTCIYAIQHLTKGGQYVGSTFLKHKTTAMMEFRFDSMGNRYVMYSKNRRGGSKQDQPLYYTLDAKGEIVYDAERFNDVIDSEKNAKMEAEKSKEFQNNFEKIMDKAKEKQATQEATFAKHENDTIDNEINLGSNEAPVQAEGPSLDSNAPDDGDAIRRSRNRTMSDVAEDVEFEEVTEL